MLDLDFIFVMDIFECMLVYEKKVIVLINNLVFVVNFELDFRIF